ncbi:rRNA-processing protein EBP2, putative [Plasmodium sp. gorilla clade G2]|uniref:rRNA-processing protein EBP2, putative n=1 Tax=Plasmodium sp. gorilla clade G2 TaxID=880535 RepID=UPI000D21CBDA|nr:rRNA-processing protein EBP2, putative [Plasmodium sp. gorilla clade G2]SOV15087.1 rRNA-processing protein EBP2, putative [Plasmodium sp. gorilla clade G2]
MKVVKKSVEKALKKKTLKEKKKKQAQNSSTEYVEKKKINKKEKKKYNNNNNNNIDEEDDEILFNQEDFEKKKQKSLENKILLSKKLKEIKLQFKDYHDDHHDEHINNNKKNSWIETLDITSTEYYYLKKTELFGISESREKQLQHITHINLIKGLQQLQALNINFNRPYDFLADMLKSDIHMEKIRQKILKEHEQAEIRESNKLKRINKKFLKKCGSQKIKSHKEALEKKQNLLKIDQLKKTNNLQNLNVQEFFLKHSKDHDNKSAKKNKAIKNKQLTTKKKNNNKRKDSSKNSSKNKKIKKKHKHKNKK